MRAAVFEGVGRPLRVEDLTLDAPRAGEVRVRLASAGVCHSDLHVVDGGWRHHTPIVLGHEGAGVVVEVGEGVTRVALGDHVIVSWMPSCGTCRQCAAGRPWLCEEALEAMETDTLPDGTMRLHRADGSPVHQYLTAGVFAEEAVIPEGGAVRIREDAPLESVSIIGCAVATGFGAVVNTARVERGSRVAVIGLGAVGLSAVQGAVHAGARTVVAVDVAGWKLDLARRLGATDVVDAGAGDPVAAVTELCGGADYAFECAGRPETAEHAVAMLDTHGAAVVVGQAEGGSSACFDPLLLSCYERRILGCNYGSSDPRVDFPRLVDLYMSGDLEVDELITGRRPLDEIEEAFADLRGARAVRTVLDCSARPAGPARTS